MNPDRRRFGRTLSFAVWKRDGCICSACTWNWYTWNFESSVDMSCRNRVLEENAASEGMWVKRFVSAYEKAPE